jgi:hypothetical protein
VASAFCSGQDDPPDTLVTVTSEQLICEWCSSEFQRPHQRGPAPKYCSRPHRQRAYEERRRVEAQLVSDSRSRRTPNARLNSFASAAFTDVLNRMNSAMKPQLLAITEATRHSVRLEQAFGATRFTEKLDGLNRATVPHLSAMTEATRQAVRLEQAFGATRFTEMLDRLNRTMEPQLSAIAKATSQWIQAEQAFGATRFTETLDRLNRTMEPQLSAIAKATSQWIQAEQAFGATRFTELFEQLNATVTASAAVSDWLLKLPAAQVWALPDFLKPIEIDDLRARTARLIETPIEDLDDDDLRTAQTDWQRVASEADQAAEKTPTDIEPAVSGVVVALAVGALLLEATSAGALVALLRSSAESAVFLAQLIAYVAASPVGVSVAFLGGLHAFRLSQTREQPLDDAS